MKGPCFSDLTPPDSLYATWLHNAGNDMSCRERNLALLSYRAGARHCYEQGYNDARQLWPEMIDGMATEPKRQDADLDGYVQILNNGRLEPMHWNEAAATGLPWLHTPRWEPRPEPTLQDAVFTFLDLWERGSEPDSEALEDQLLFAADAMRRALEQAGEAQD